MIDLSPTNLQSISYEFPIWSGGLRLVVTLAVCNCLLSVAPIRQGVANVGHIPFAVFLFLQDLDPHVRDCHGKSVVKSNASER